MKIAADSISDKKIRIEEDIPAKAWEMDSAEVSFNNSVHIDCECVKINQEIVVEAKITTQRDASCSRCLNRSSHNLTQNFKRSYSLQNIGEHLDLSQDMREEILLNFPMKVLCAPDCKGICTGCGVNLNIDKCKC